MDRVCGSHHRQQTLEPATKPKRVTAVIVGSGPKVLVDVKVGDEIITATDGHPFFVRGEGWVDAEDLEAGDPLRDQTAGSLRIRSVDDYEVAQRVVYNLTVADIHTYHVGEKHLLVHNCTGTPRPRVHSQKKVTPPSWVQQGGHYPEITDLNPASAARRILDEQYGPGGWSGTGAGSELSVIQKWASRNYQWGN